MTKFRAKYKGKCVSCLQNIAPGDYIIRRYSGYEHISHKHERDKHNRELAREKQAATARPPSVQMSLF